MADGDIHITKDHDKGTLYVGEELARTPVISCDGETVLAEVVLTRNVLDAPLTTPAAHPRLPPE